MTVMPVGSTLGHSYKHSCGTIFEVVLPNVKYLKFDLVDEDLLEFKDKVTRFIHVRSPLNVLTPRLVALLVLSPKCGSSR